MTETRTPDHCLVDHHAWVDQDYKRLTYRQLEDRSTELIECNVYDPAHREAYTALYEIYVGAEHLRFRDFLKRHNLEKEFAREDAAGQP